jgi:small GTP-binding protein
LEKPIAYVHKLVFLGDSGVGKTSLVQRYVYDSLDTSLARTIGAVLHVKTVPYEGERHKLVIWDLGGEEAFSQLREQYCANASGAFFVFNTTIQKTFESMDTWLEALYTSAGNVPVVIVENKIDLDSNTSPELIKQKTQEKVLKHIRTSALEDTNVDLAFTELVGSIMTQMRKTRDQPL